MEENWYNKGIGSYTTGCIYYRVLLQNSPITSANTHSSTHFVLDFDDDDKITILNSNDGIYIANYRVRGAQILRAQWHMTAASGHFSRTTVKLWKKMKKVLG